MGKQIRIEKIKTSDGEIERTIDVQIDDDLIKNLELYKECCDKLSRSAFLSEEINTSLKMYYDDSEQSLVFKGESPSDQVLDGFLLRLRPFILNDEPTNFNYITIRLKGLLSGSVFEQKINNIKKYSMLIT